MILSCSLHHFNCSAAFWQNAYGSHGFPWTTRPATCSHSWVLSAPSSFTILGWQECFLLCCPKNVQAWESHLRVHGIVPTPLRSLHPKFLPTWGTVPDLQRLGESGDFSRSHLEDLSVNRFGFATSIPSKYVKYIEISWNCLDMFSCFIYLLLPNTF